MTQPIPDLVPTALKFGANQIEFRKNADNLVANFPQLQAAAAQFSLGKMYMDGLGVTQDQPQAVTWFRQAADQGHAGAQRMLGVMYEYGLGVLHHGEQAVAWYRKSAELGAASAPTRISALHRAW